MKRALLLPLLAACAADPVRPVEIPLDRPIQVVVNGKGPYPFGLDTGQSVAFLFTQALADELQFEVVGQSPVSDGSGENNATVDIVHVDSVELAGLSLGGMTGIVFDPNNGETPHRGGVLGFPAFAGMLMTMDGDAIRVEPGELPEPDGETILPFTMPRNLPRIDVEIGGRKLNAVIDSGNPKFLTLPLSLADDLGLRDDLVVTGRMATLFNEFDVHEATFDGDLRIGSHVWHNPRLEFNDVLPDANVGRGILRELTVTFDQENRRVRFVRR